MYKNIDLYTKLVHNKHIMSRTNIVLDDTLLREASRLTKIKTKKNLVHRALADLVKAEKRKAILKLEGQIHWNGSLAAMRRGRKWS